MKKIIFYLVIALSLGSASSVLAQNENQQSKMKQMLKDSLQLSDAMADSVISIHTQFQPQQKQIFTDQTLSAEQKKTKMNDLRTQIEARYKSAGLSDTQITQLEAMMRKMREQMRNKPNNSGQ
ncbi:MAG: hypothetical protein ACR2FN_12980 [Chitinophagaceae bacterium]